jgi:hypothetical protein
MIPFVGSNGFRLSRPQKATPPSVEAAELSFHADGTQPATGVEALVFMAAADRFEFAEDFEGVSRVEQLRGSDGWTGAQLVRGSIAMSETRSHGGDASLYMVADNNIGKAHVFKAEYWENAGDFVEASAWFWFPKNVSLDDVYIMDWESKSVWSSANAKANPQPGIRIGLFGEEGAIAVERGKMGIGSQRDFVAEDFAMPREKWVNVEWRMKLGVGKAGYTEVEVDGKTVIEAHGTTYIDPAAAARNGIKLSADYAFDRFKVGLTANSSDQRFGAYVDDIGVSTWDASEGAPDWFL